MKWLCLVLAICTVLAPGAVADIPVDDALLLWIGEGNGDAEANDLTGNGNDGVLAEGARWVLGKYGGGISLESDGSYLEIANVLTEMGTIEFWFRPKWSGDSGDPYRIFDAGTGTIYFFISKGAAHADINPQNFGFYFEDATDADWQDIEFNPAGVILEGEWFHVAATWETGEVPYLYINGEEMGTSPRVMGAFPTLNPTMRFGWETVAYVAMGNGANGVIDEIGVYSRALAADEIQADMERTAAAVDATGKLAVSWGALRR